MGDLIERQAAINAVGLTTWAGSRISRLHAIDAVPVVRCKDCRFHEHEEPGMAWCPNVVGAWMTEEGYCSMGERREG